MSSLRVCLNNLIFALASLKVCLNNLISTVASLKEWFTCSFGLNDRQHVHFLSISTLSFCPCILLAKIMAFLFKVPLRFAPFVLKAKQFVTKPEMLKIVILTHIPVYIHTNVFVFAMCIHAERKQFPEHIHDFIYC